MPRRWKFDKRLRKAKRLKLDIMREASEIGLRHFRQSFRLQKFNDSGASTWASRKRPRRGAILVKSGALRNSLETRSFNSRMARVGSYTTSYAGIHNRGLTGKAFGRSRFKMPERKFIGESKTLENKINKLIRKKVKEFYKSTR